MSKFDRQYKYGLAGETVIARWLRSRGGLVMPVYEKIVDTGKGPRLFVPGGELVAPDLLTCNNGRATWVEAKHKTAFTWHRITSRWVTGIDLHHYTDYLEVAHESKWPVWLLFLQDGGEAKDSPTQSPSGLFGNDLIVLQGCENHRHNKGGKHGMVYWAIDSLMRLATLDEINSLAPPA